MISKKVSTVQACVIIINYILAAGILTLPRTATEAIKTPDVWISVLIGGLATILIGVILVKLSKFFPGKTYYEYNQILLGKWLGGGLSLVVILYFLTLSSYEIRILSEVTGFLILEGTPNWAIIMPILWIGYYLLLGGLNSLARLFEIIFPITVIFFLLAILMSAQVFEMDNLRPVLGQGIMPIFHGLKSTIFSFLGIEIILIIYAFLEKPDKGYKIVMVGVLVTAIFYFITVIMVIGALSVDGVIHRTWPTIDLIRSYEIEGLLFERFESFLMVIWTMQIFATYSITYFAAALGISQVFKRDIRIILLALLPVIYIMALAPNNIEELFTLSDFIGYAFLIFFGLLPLPLLVLAKWKVKSTNENSKM